MSRGFRTVALVLAVLHVSAFLGVLISASAARSGIRARFDPTLPPNRSFLFTDVARLLPALLEAVPEDATLTVVNGLVQPFPFQIHLEPRRTHSLQAFDEQLLARVAGTRPRWERLARERFAHLEREHRRLTAEYLQEALADSEFLLLFHAPDLVLLAGDYRFEPVDVRRDAQGQEVGLYRVLAP